MCPGPEGQNPSAPRRGRAAAGTKVHAEKEDQLGVAEAMDVRHPRRLPPRPKVVQEPTGSALIAAMVDGRSGIKGKAHGQEGTVRDYPLTVPHRSKAPYLL